MLNSHFVCDLPPIWEHAGARVVLGEHVDGLMKALELEPEEASETTHCCRDRCVIVEVRACVCCQKPARTSIVGLLTNFLSKERSGVQGVARGVNSDEISSLVQVILKCNLTHRI